MEKEYRHNDEVILTELKWIKEAITDFKISNSCEHREVIEHQKITNGRVNELEKEMSFAKGGVKILGILIVPMFISVAIYVINFFLNR